ncbi:MAG TPA: S9 family peptidase [Steroidobacteraceae bacterium]
MTDGVVRHRGQRSCFVRSVVPVVAALIAAISARSASLEDYGRLPSIENVSLSPDGTRVAFVRTNGDARVVSIGALADGKILSVLQVGDEKLRSLEWADDAHLLIVTSTTAAPFHIKGPEREWVQLRVYDMDKHRAYDVPDLPQLAPVQVMNVLRGEVMVRRVADHTALFVPSLYGEGGEAPRLLRHQPAVGGALEHVLKPILIRVNLDTGRETVVEQARDPDTQWLVDDTGEVVAEQDYEDRSQSWAMQVRRGGHMEVALSGHAGLDFPRLLGFGPQPDTLLMRSFEDDAPVWRLLSLTDGTLGPPMAERKVMDTPIEDRLTHRMIGGVHFDDDSHYLFFEPAMQASWDSIVRAFKGARVQFVSASSDNQKIVVRIEGASFGYQYSLIDLTTHKAEPLGDVYHGITAPLETQRITYPAADGLDIPAYLTLPRDHAAKALPLIVLPHGGPALHDSADFDWWSQALADQGYGVLRPNYRGSTLSRRFQTAGFTQWGRKMQTDLSDGVRYLVKQGIADPARVCIVGDGYGGYAALAGVTLDPGVYRCAVAVAGVSDLKGFLNWVSDKQERSDNPARRFWDRYLGVSGPGDPVLEQISPIRHIQAVTVPVLLIHGKDDTMVPFEQSQEMYDALRAAHKDVQLVVLEHEDHWLSRSATRLQMLESSVAFLRAHNPPD